MTVRNHLSFSKLIKGRQSMVKLPLSMSLLPNVFNNKYQKQQISEIKSCVINSYKLSIYDAQISIGFELICTIIARYMIMYFLRFSFPMQARSRRWQRIFNQYSKTCKKEMFLINFQTK
jgi:hypothetical protein